jgi:C4-dicarboxylate-specific signal transduction histidine kinase
MNITTDPNLWAICILVFLLGLLIGVFLTAGGRRKWRTRYKSEVDRREALEREHAEREKEWRERDSLRNAAVRDRRDPDDDRPL